MDPSVRRDDENSETPSFFGISLLCVSVVNLYSHEILGAGPSLAGPRNISPFWIVNEVAISGRPAGPAFASIARAIRARRASLGFIRPAATSALINSS